MAIKIGVVNQKGGAGKTTTAIELAACFSNSGYKVLFIDLDMQMNSTKCSGGDRNANGIFEALCGTVNARDVIQHVKEYDLLGANGALSTADAKFTDAIDSLRLKEVLKNLNDEYDFIIMDTHPGKNRLLSMTYVASDYLIIPTLVDECSVDGIQLVLDDIEKYKMAKLSDADLLGVVLCAYENTSLHALIMEEVRNLLSSYDPNAFLVPIRKGIAVSEIKYEHWSLQAGKHSSNPAIDYRALAEKVLEQCI